MTTYTFTNVVSDPKVFESLQRQDTATSSVSSATSASSVASSAPPDENHGGSLSAGAKIGIGVGVSVVVLFVLGMAVVLFWRPRKLRRQREARNSESNFSGEKAEQRAEGGG